MQQMGSGNGSIQYGTVETVYWCIREWTSVLGFQITKQYSSGVDEGKLDTIFPYYCWAIIIFTHTEFSVSLNFGDGPTPATEETAIKPLFSNQFPSH